MQVSPGTPFRLVIALLMGSKGAGSCFGWQHKLYTTDEGRKNRWQDIEWGWMGQVAALDHITSSIQQIKWWKEARSYFTV